MKNFGLSKQELDYILAQRTPTGLEVDLANMFNAETTDGADTPTHTALVAALEQGLGERMDRIADQLEQLVACFKGKS